MAGKEQRDKEVDKEVCRTLQNKENNIREYSGVRVTSIDKNSPGG